MRSTHDTHWHITQRNRALVHVCTCWPSASVSYRPPWDLCTEKTVEKTVEKTPGTLGNSTP